MRGIAICLMLVSLGCEGPESEGTNALPAPIHLSTAPEIGVNLLEGDYDAGVIVFCMEDDCAPLIGFFQSLSVSPGETWQFLVFCPESKGVLEEMEHAIASWAALGRWWFGSWPVAIVFMNTPDGMVRIGIAEGLDDIMNGDLPQLIMPAQH